MKYITETYNLIMDSKINPLSKIPNLQVRHLVMQLLAYMWSLIFGIYIVESIYAFGISALAHSLLIVAIIITMAVFDTAEREPELFNDELAFLISEGIELFEGNTYDKNFFDREDERQSNLSTKQQEDLEANIKGLKEIMGADYE